MKIALYVVVLAAAVAVPWVRLAPLDPARWHVDPLVATPPARPNFVLLRPGDSQEPPPEFAMPAAELARAFDRIALASPRVRRLAGGPEAGLATYVARTKWLGFPDLISVRAVDPGGGRSALAVFSRSRFGHADFGVNRARLADWLGRLRAGAG